MCMPGGKDGSGDADNAMEFVTIQTTGNAIDFGDLQHLVDLVVVVSLMVTEVYNHVRI